MGYINTCSFAAENDHLDCLKYAHEHGCPIDVQVCISVCKSSECLEYLNNSFIFL